MTFASMARGFAPTGKYFKVLEGYYRGHLGEAYKFLEWGGVAVRVIGTEARDIVVCATEQVQEVTAAEYEKAVRRHEFWSSDISVIKPYLEHWNPNKPIDEE